MAMKLVNCQKDLLMEDCEGLGDGKSGAGDGLAAGAGGWRVWTWRWACFGRGRGRVCGGGWRSLVLVTGWLLAQGMPRLDLAMGLLQAVGGGEGEPGAGDGLASAGAGGCQRLDSATGSLLAWARASLGRAMENQALVMGWRLAREMENLDWAMGSPLAWVMVVCGEGDGESGAGDGPSGAGAGDAASGPGDGLASGVGDGVSREGGGWFPVLVTGWRLALGMGSLHRIATDFGI